MDHLSEKQESLWMLAASPTIWAGHFLMSYITAAVWCAKVGAPLGPVRWAIAAFTAVALGGIGLVAWRAARRNRVGGTSPRHGSGTTGPHGSGESGTPDAATAARDDDTTGAGDGGATSHQTAGATDPRDIDTPENRHRFMGRATLLLSGLSAVATIFVAMTAVFIKTCH